MRVPVRSNSEPNLATRLGLARRLAADRRGVVAVFFALAAVFLVPMTLGLMDVFTISSQRTRLQDALDTATLFAARSTAVTTPGVDAVGDKSLTANLVLPVGVSLVASDFAVSGDLVTGYAEITPSALAPGLWPHDNIRAYSSVVRSLDQLEIALVLDNTGSMAGTKIATLKSAANNLIDTLVTASARSHAAVPLRVSLVPFSMTVRVQATTPTTNYNTVAHSGAGFPTWLDPLGKAHAAAGAAGLYDSFPSQTDRWAMLKGMNKQPWEGCVESRMPPYDILETAPNPATPATMFVPYFWPDEPDASAGFSGYPNDYLPDQSAGTWKVREQNPSKYTVAPKVGTMASTGYKYGPNGGCAMQPIIRLTATTSSIKTAINAMVAVGDTNIPMGMMWGWHTLSPSAPLADGAPYSTPNLRKILILMTDGDNTMGDPSSNLEQNRSYFSGLAYIWQNLLGITVGTTAQRNAAMNARQIALCDNIKAQGIVIYTVRVEVLTGPSPALSGCASSADKYYDVQDVHQLDAAFAAIAGSIDSLRISH